MRSRNAIMLSVFKSYCPNLEWPPKSKMVTRKFNNYASASKLTQTYSVLHFFWENMRSIIQISYCYFISYGPNSKWHLKLRCPSNPESFNLYPKLTQTCIFCGYVWSDYVLPGKKKEACMNLHVISHFKVLIQLVLLVQNKTKLASNMSEGMDMLWKSC